MVNRVRRKLLKAGAAAAAMAATPSVLAQQGASVEQLRQLEAIPRPGKITSGKPRATS